MKRLLKNPSTGNQYLFSEDYEGWANNWAPDSACYDVSAPSAQFQLIGWKAISNENKKSIKNLSVKDDASINSKLKYVISKFNYKQLYSL